MLEKDPSIIYDVEKLLKKYSDRTTEEKESEYPFVECVTWADDIKRRGGAWQSSWHYEDNVFIGDNSSLSDLKIHHDYKNISLALPILFTWLKDGAKNPNNLSPNVTRSLIYEKIMK